MLGSSCKSNGISNARQKLGLDFATVPQLVRHRGADMDKDDRDLIVRLCTQAGCMMEDASVTAISAAGLEPAQLRSAVDSLVQTANDIRAVLLAAQIFAASRHSLD
jgi:hypothetical protein